VEIRRYKMNKKITIILIAVVLLLIFLFDFSTHFTKVSVGKAESPNYLLLKWGNGENEVGLKGPYEGYWYFGPSTFDVDKQGNVYIVDQLNRRIIEVNQNGEVLKSINIDKLLFGEDPENLLPVQLIVTDKCMFLKYNYRLSVPIPDPTAYYVSIIKDNDIKTLNASGLLGRPVDVLMERFAKDKIVLTPSIPPEDEPLWKGPKAVIVDDQGKTKVINEIKNGSYDGVTPGINLQYKKYKDTWLYEDTRIEVKDPVTGRDIFVSEPLENGAPIDVFHMRFNGKKAVIMYHTADSWNEEAKTVTTHIAIFGLNPKTEEHYVMVVGDQERKEVLPPPFYYKEDYVLGDDDYYYMMLYTKDGLLISKFVPEVNSTTYQYRFFKFVQNSGKS